jgi:hypothetical protein
MSYTSNRGYKNDVFISYAHADNEPLGASIRWVSNFVEDLKSSLEKKLGRKDGEEPTVWIDHELAKNIPLTDALTDAIKQTATYIIIMSPAYLVSDWCRKERQQFFEILKQKGAKTRVFLIEIDEVERNKYPIDIDSNLVSYVFWNRLESNSTITLGIPDRNNEKYFERLVSVVKDLAEELKKIKNTAPQQLTSTNQQSKGTVFLAQVTDDLDDKREEIKGYLKDEGYEILPEENWYQSYEPGKLRENIEQNLTNCTLYMQLLSNLPGKKLPGNTDSISKFQFDIAKTSGKKMMIWRPPDLKTDEVKDANLKAILESVYVRAEGIEEFKLALKKALTPPPPLPDIETESDNPKFVYICTDQNDREYSEKIIKNAIKGAGFGCSLPIMSNNAVAVKNYQKQNFIESYATLFVYCQSEPDGVFSRILECYKVRAQRKKPFRALAIFDGPPKQSEEGTIEIELPQFEIANLNCRENILEFTDKFLKKL